MECNSKFAALGNIEVLKEQNSVFDMASWGSSYTVRTFSLVHLSLKLADLGKKQLDWNERQICNNLNMIYSLYCALSRVCLSFLLCLMQYITKCQQFATTYMK